MENSFQSADGEAEVLYEFEVSSSECYVPQNSIFYGHPFNLNECKQKLFRYSDENFRLVLFSLDSIGIDEPLLDLDKFFSENTPSIQKSENSKEVDSIVEFESVAFPTEPVTVPFDVSQSKNVFTTHGKDYPCYYNLP